DDDDDFELIYTYFKTLLDFANEFKGNTHEIALENVLNSKLHDENLRLSLQTNVQLEGFLEWSNLNKNSKIKPTSCGLEPVLNENDHTEDLILSIQRLSARSNSNSQSVRSLCDVSKGVFYHEVVLLSN